MNARRHRRFQSISTAAALLWLGTFAGPAFAGTPPTTPAPTPTETSPATGDTTLGAGDATPAAGEAPIELVQSWTLTPGGSANGDQAGSRPNLSYQVAAGSVVNDTVIVYNLGNVPMDFKVYATDAFNNDEGDFDLLPGGQVPVDAGSWVNVAQSGIVLPPGKQATIPITITVPIDATPGDHVGAVVASNIAVSDNGDGKIVNVDRRTGTRLYVQVDGPLTPDLAVTALDTTYHHALNSLAGSADVTFRVENRGNVRLGGTPTVTVAGPFGIGERTITLAKLTELLPGQDVTVTAKLNDVPATMLVSTTVRIESIRPGVTGGADVATGDDRTFAPPITVLMVLIVLLLGVMARRRYRRHKEASAGVAAAIVISDGESQDELPVLEPQHQ